MMNTTLPAETHFTTKTAEVGPVFYTLKQAAIRLNVSEKTVRRWISRRLLSPSPALYKKLIPRQQVEGFAERAEKLLAA